MPKENLLDAAARRRPDDRLPRPEPGPAWRSAPAAAGTHAGDAGEHAALGRVPPDLRRSRSRTRELVRRRIGRLAGLIVGCDALVAWCSWLLDQGYRGEMECIIAKIFGSEAQKEAAIELFMKTHGGRAFLHGHLFGDNVHEYLAPCIYEGEGEMLGMAFFKSLVKEHGKTFFEPIGKALQAARASRRSTRSTRPTPGRCASELAPYAKWWLGQKLAGRDRQQPCRAWTRRLAEHVRVRRWTLSGKPRMEISGDDAQASAQAGRPPVPDGRAVAARAGHGRDARDGLWAGRQNERGRPSPRPTSSARTCAAS